MAIPTNKGWTTCMCLQHRHGVILLGFLMGSLLYSLRFNLSIAIVAMVDQDAEMVALTQNKSQHEIAAAQICPALVDPHENTLRMSLTTFEGGPPRPIPKFKWNEKDQGLILASFFWGYIISQFPSGLIAQKYGPKWIIGLGVLFTGILSLVLPHAAVTGGRDMVILVRFFQGIGEGLAVPAMIVLLAKWMPPLERARLSTLCFAGMPFGTAATMLISGPLITTFGWPSVFYVPGVLTLFWFLWWANKIHSSPDEHPDISRYEMEYIRKSKQAALQDGKTLPPDQPLNFSDIPWKQIACSAPVWCVFLSQFFNCWGHNMLKSEGPKYLHSALHFDIHSNGYFSAMPYIFQCIFAMIIGRLSDLLIERKLITMLTARRICNSIGQWGAGLAFAGIILSGCNRPLAVFCYVMSGMINGAMLGGSIVNIIDIAPNYSGAIEGVINSISNIAGFGAPTVAGFILYYQPTLLGWSFVFLIPVISNIVGNLAFLLGSSVEQQPWDEVTVPIPPKKDEPELELD